MHPLRNGSQVTVRPSRKPTQGTEGYFSESNDLGNPSYPGQDWFNDVIDEFKNALTAMGVDYTPGNLTHLAQMFAVTLQPDDFSTSAQAKAGTDNETVMTPLRVKEAYTQHGHGIESPPLIGNFNETAIVNDQMYRTDGTTTGPNPVPGTNGYVHYQRWGANDFVQFFWPATVTDAQLWFRRWKSGVFQPWVPFFTAINEQQIGYKQTYQDETANRLANTAYKNTYGKPIMVSTNIQSGGKFEVSPDGVTWLEINTWSSVSGAPTTPIIPVNWWYRSTSFYGKWMELK